LKKDKQVEIPKEPSMESGREEKKQGEAEGPNIFRANKHPKV
jgi:hypothetical protein